MSELPPHGDFSNASLAPHPTRRVQETHGLNDRQKAGIAIFMMGVGIILYAPYSPTNLIGVTLMGIGAAVGLPPARN